MSDKQRPTPETMLYQMTSSETGEEVSYLLPLDVYNRLVYLEAQEHLLETWQQRCKRAEETIAEIQRPLDAEMALLNRNLIAANRERDEAREELARALKRVDDFEGVISTLAKPWREEIERKLNTVSLRRGEEPTQEMLEAGALVIWEHASKDKEELIRRAYKAMRALTRSAKPGAGEGEG